MTGLFILLGGMVLFAAAITLMDWIGERQRKAREAKGAPRY